MGAEPRERFDTGYSPDTTTRSLGPDLYSGTSGVALFLGELFALTGDPTLRAMAPEPSANRWHALNSIRAVARLGAFTGWTGIALAAARLAVLLVEPGLSSRAGELLDRVMREERHRQEFDIISGRAGAIATLIVLS